MQKRTIFIGDVHGCFEELCELVEKLAIAPEDRVIFTGDLINKGPSSVEVIRYVYKNGYECVLGNHELSYIKRYQIYPEYQKYYTHFTGEIHNWIVGLPSYIEGPDFIAVHAGIVPGYHPKETDKEETCKMRYLHQENTLFYPKKEGTIPWYEVYSEDKKVIYGHWASKGLMVTENTIGLDSGCVYGGELSAYILETNEIIQVKAKKVYKEIN